MKATQESTDLATFFQAALKLKTVKRQGWKNSLALNQPESVADHCFAMTAIAMVLSDKKNLDTAKVLRMSLLHDLAESLVGDIVPEAMSKSKKMRLENAAMKKIFKKLDSRLRKEYWEIWQEYQKHSSDEAVFLHQVDKLEMALQAGAYREQGHKETRLRKFLESARDQIGDADMKKFLPDF